MQTNTATVYFDICDNAISGTIPLSIARTNAFVSLSYNPFLVGPAPAGLAIWTGNCGFNYQGTSVGLDEPLSSILDRVSAAIDPSSAVLTSWGLSSQPCAPYSGQPGGTTAAATSRNGYGASFLGVTCINGGTGGISSLSLINVGLNGSVPYDLARLRTLVTLDISRNLLVGSLPQNWGNNITWRTGFASSPGFDSLNTLNLWSNSISGPVPPNLGLISLGVLPTANLCDNLVRPRSRCLSRACPPARLRPLRCRRARPTVLQSVHWP